MQVTFNGLQFWYDDEVEYSAGHYLLREKQPQPGIYVLKKGSVEILKNGKQVAVISKFGEMFGEISALTGEDCSTTVRLLQPSIFLVVKDANSFLENNAKTAVFVAKMLARRLSDTTEKLVG